MNDLPLFASARTTDPETSKANRDAFRAKASQRDVVLSTYSNWPLGLTDEEAGMRTVVGGLSMFEQRACYWKRCSELRKLGFVRATGETRTSALGQEQQVCTITDEGARYVEELKRRGLV